MDGIIGEKSNINSNSLFSDAGEDFYRQFSTALSSAERVVVDMTSVREKRRIVSSQYLEFLKAIVSCLVQSGEKVFLLNHEGKQDEMLMKELNGKLEEPLPLLTGLSGMELKTLIRDSKLLISARFHGAVSGLTQGVPTLCTSWSHKYAELLKEHKCGGNILRVENLEEAKHIVADALLHPNDYISKQGCEKEIEKKVTVMWEEVFNGCGLQ